MKKNILFLLLVMIIIPFKVYAAGGFGLSSSAVTLHPGETATITISSDNSVGKLNISSGNSSVASISTGSVFIQTPGSSQTFVITAGSVGSTTISVVASNDYATMDEEILSGQTKTVLVNVVEKQVEQTPNVNNNQNNNSNQNQNKNTNQNVNQNTQTTSKSKNNNLKSITIEGYELNKIDNQNYTLEVANDITSININIEAEDSKATITGNGMHELAVGENKIEIVITSESGAKNTIILTVTRKDGYYIEDLDNILNNNITNDLNIIVKSDTILTNAEINKIKTSGKIVKFNYYDENKKLIYSWIIDGSKIDNINSLNTTINYGSENIENISNLANYADGLYLTLKHDGTLPKNTKIKIYVGDKYNNGDIVNLYYYDKDNNNLEIINQNLEVIDGYIEISLEHASEYFITKAILNNNVIENHNYSYLFFTIAIIELIVIITLIVIYFIKIKPLIKKDNNVNNMLNNNNLYS